MRQTASTAAYVAEDRNQRQRRVRKVLLAIDLAWVIFGTGACLSIATCDGHWLTRSGAVIVVIALAMALVQFRHPEPLRLLDVAVATNNWRQQSLHEQRQAALDRHRDAQVAEVREQFMTAEFALALVGTLIWGFGDLPWCLASGSC